MKSESPFRPIGVDVMQFYELVSRVCMSLDRSDLSGSSLASLGSTRAGQWINDVRLDIANKYKFAFYYSEATLNTVVASAYYPLPSDLLDHFSVFVGDSKLTRYSMQNFDEQISSQAVGSIASNTASGRPNYYVLRGTQFQLYPTPNDTYQINLRYYARPETFTASSDFDVASNAYPDAIIFGATMRGSLWLEDKYNEQRYQQLYDGKIKEMLINEKEKEMGDAHYRMKSWRDFNLSKFGDLVKVNYDGRTGRRRTGSNFSDQG